MNIYENIKNNIKESEEIYTAVAYDEGGAIHDSTEYYDLGEAIDFVKNRNWDAVIDKDGKTLYSNRQNDFDESNKEIQAKAKAMALDSETNKSQDLKESSNWMAYQQEIEDTLELAKDSLDPEMFSDFCEGVINLCQDYINNSNPYGNVMDSELHENVGDKHDYSSEIVKLAKEYLSKEIGKIRTALKGYDIDSKTTEDSILYKLSIHVLTISSVYDMIDDIGEYITNHIPALTYEGSIIDNMTGIDKSEDIILKFKQNFAIKDFGDDIMGEEEKK